LVVVVVFLKIFIHFQKEIHIQNYTNKQKNMLSNQSTFLYYLKKFYNEKVLTRKAKINQTIHEVARIVFDVLKEVEIQEPRFISQLNEINGRYDGISVISPTEFEVVLYLNQMGVFNFVDDNSSPGCALLKLSDGRKRSMSLWVEFITASGYLSARKIRARFHALVAQACEKCVSKDQVKLMPNDLTGGTEVKLKIRDLYVVNVVPAFKCSSYWPRSASAWPISDIWPSQEAVNKVKQDGFHLLSKETFISKEKLSQQYQQHQAQIQSQQSSSEGDSWIISLNDSEERLLVGGTRRKCLSLLKTLRDRHLDLPGQPVTNNVIKNLVLYECEKHPYDSEWEENNLGDRLNGIFLQLIAYLQSRKFPAYFLPNVDIFRGVETHYLDLATKKTWRLQRELMFNSKSMDKL
jgi:putative nucleotidyltransferase